MVSAPRLVGRAQSRLPLEDNSSPATGDARGAQAAVKCVRTQGCSRPGFQRSPCSSSGVPAEAAAARQSDSFDVTSVSSSPTSKSRRTDSTVYGNGV